MNVRLGNNAKPREAPTCFGRLGRGFILCQEIDGSHGWQHVEPGTLTDNLYCLNTVASSDELGYFGAQRFWEQHGDLGIKVSPWAE